MSLDPAIKNFLETIKSMNIPPFSQMKVDEVRKLMDNNPILSPTEPINRKEDLSFTTNGFEIRMRLYIPENATDGLIFYIHGGGFVFGSIESVEAPVIRLANSSKCRVLSVSYRMGPENRFPAALEDVYSSYEWAVKNSTRLGFDAAKIAVCGDSAGANLATVLCIKLKEKRETLPRLEILFYPYVGPDVYSESQREFGEGFFLTNEDMLWFSTNYLSASRDAFDPYFSPIFYPDLSGMPETFMITGEHDPLRDQGQSYLSRLNASGVQTTGIQALGMIHGFVSFINIAPSARNIVTMIGSLIAWRLNETPQ
ncbi:MAG: alpha/beta hydrolase [Thermoplasmatales archaeon]|nr:alpha/beta hydrolase [Candidatus Thermoplasmatota archaeon]MCL6003532.1 alpha/beta hydrolase [Candidatus Thermoplasmatota archaeon]MDA8054115.1 alpha/beta hydrolase [Thermoplasmatales archaeon]